MKIEEFYAKLLGRQELVFDIGAHHGETAVVLAGFADQVIAVEPVYESHEKLCANVRGLPVCARFQACGAEEGEALIYTSQDEPDNGCASMSDQFIGAVVKSNRFGKDLWNIAQPTRVTTLDRLINSFGKPGFIKIDVEGFEFDVLMGLSKAVPLISFEFTPEMMWTAIASLVRCASLGMTEFNFSCMQNYEWVGDCVGLVAMIETLQQLSKAPGNTFYGDVYARIPR